MHSTNSRYWHRPREITPERYDLVRSVVYYAFLEYSFHGLEFPWCTGYETLGSWEDVFDVQAYIKEHLGVTVNEDFIWRAEAVDLVEHICKLTRQIAIARDLRVKRR